jgi:hypothetical protein
MRKVIYLIAVLCLSHTFAYGAEDFLGAPLAPDSKIKLKTDSRLEILVPLSHDEVLKFYRAALKGEKDIKYRDWKTDTYIEDDAAREWHSITISKTAQEGGGTLIIIVKDNWTWIIGTLILRYIGVFVVLLFLFAGIAISGAIISRLVKKAEGQKA